MAGYSNSYEVLWHVVGKHILYSGLDRMGEQGVEIWPIVSFWTNGIGEEIL